MIISSVLFSVLFNVNLTSFLKFLIIAEIVWLVGFLTNHHFLLRAKGRMVNIIHDMENREVLGSNTENRFVIILLVFLLD